MIETFKVLFTYEQDPETGDIKCINREVINDDIKPAKKASTTKKKTTSKEESSTPQLILSDNKYTLNSAAVELMGVEPDDRLDIKYEKKGKLMIPIIGTNESFGTKAGNRLTKSFTVSYRGKANEELANYGSVFTITEHSSKEGIFVLTGDNAPEAVEDEKVTIKDEASEIEVDIDLNDFSDLTEDDAITEINALDFTL
jgi:hypothetical protein